MKHILLSARDLGLMVCLCAIILAAATGIEHGLSTAVFFEQLNKLGTLTPQLSLGLLCICIQLAVMRWGGILMNAGLTCTSILLFAMMTTMALGPQISMTESLYTMAQGAGVEHPFRDNPALYGIIPVAWFLCLIGANSQVRAFCTALMCYAAWVIFTPMVQNIFTNWAEQADPPMPGITDVMTGADWMPAAVVGSFLLIFALVVGLLDSAFPENANKNK